MSDEHFTGFIMTTDVGEVMKCLCGTVISVRTKEGFQFDSAVDMKKVRTRLEGGELLSYVSCPNEECEMAIVIKGCGTWASDFVNSIRSMIEAGLSHGKTFSECEGAIFKLCDEVGEEDDPADRRDGVNDNIRILALQVLDSYRAGTP